MLVALLGTVTASAKTVYIQPGNWSNDDAIISVNVWGDGTNDWVESLTEVETGIFKATIGDDKTTMAVVRGTEAKKWKSEGAWNQTGDIAITDGKLYKLYDWDNSMDGIYVGHGVVEEDYTEPVAAGYTVDFNTAIATSSHGFAVASNWKHIVGSANGDGYGPYYMSYSYASDKGVDGSGALSIGAQYGYDMGSANSSWPLSDYLITPKVSGTVTLKVKVSYTSYTPYVKFYKANDNGTEVGDELTADITPELSTEDWSTVTLTVAETTRIAIKGQYVYIDDFTATAAEIAAEPALSIVSVKRADSESTTYFDANADGSYTVNYKVVLKNTGEVDLVAGTSENYTLSVSIDGTSYGSFDIPVDLAVGETSDEFVASIVVPAGAPTGWKYRYLKENVSGGLDNSSLAWSSVITFNPVPFFIEQGNEPNNKNNAPTNVTSLDFGMISSADTKHYEIFAHNAGDLTIKSIVAPEGFSVAPAETLPYTIAAHTGMNVDVTADAVATTSGNMVITYVDKNGDDQTANVVLSQTVINASKWLATFDGNVWPDNTIHQSSLSFYTSAYYGLDCAVKGSYNYSNKFITPLLHATAGESLKFDAMLDYNSGNVKVYVTTDRTVLGDPVLTLTNAQLNTSSLTAQSITVETEGDYYVVFEIYQAYIDNIYGFEKVDVAHDIMVNSYQIGSTDGDKSIQTGTEQSFNFEILPVQAEAADAYAVKLFANGEVVATAEADALTAGTAKKFTIKWTPEVNNTTVFETYAAIVFNDNTQVKSPSLNLTVTCEPVFVFFNAGTVDYNNGNQPSTRSTAINFGNVNETGLVQNFEIYNFGKAPLTIKSVSVPEGFSTNAGSAVVAAKERLAVDITFSATTPAIYSGNLSIVYVDKDGVDQTFELPVTGTLLDASKWYANFDNASSSSIVWPAGLVYESSIQTSYSGWGPYNNFVYTYGSTESNNKIITPLLRAAAGDKLSFDVKNYGYSSHKVNVYLSTDRENWGEAIYTNESIDNSDFATIEATIPEAGEYYVGIAMTGVYVDELYGLTPVAVAHDWKLVSSNIPAEGMQNYTSTATVNVLNLGIKDEVAEDITVTAYVDGKAVATAEGVAIPMSHQLSATGTQLSVSYMVNKAGTFPVYVEVKAGDYSVATEPVDVTFAEEIAISGVQVGTKSTTASSVPFYTTWMDHSSGKSMSDFIYTPEQLAASGISAGAKITSITFVGTPSGTKTISSLTTDAWIAQQAVSDFTAGSPNTDEMTHVNIHNAESVTFTSGTAYEFKIDLTENPIVYDGESGIRIYTNINGNGQYQSINFDIDNNYKNAYYAYGSGSFSSVTGNPVAFFNLAVETATLAGNVKTSANEAIEGATITLKADNGVEYSGTTAADGSYSFNVIQAGLDFTATVEAEGFLKRQFDYSLEGESKTLDVTMYTKFGIVGTLPGINSWNDDLELTQSADDPNIFTAELNNVAVEAGEYTYKLRADGAWNSDLAGEGYELPSSGNYSWNFSVSGNYNFKFTFDWTNHELTFERPFTLAEDNTADIADLNWVDVTVEREFKKGWNAVVLPFALSADEVTAAFGEDSELAVYDGDTNDGGDVTVKFKKIEGEYKYISAGYPYMLYLENAVSGLKFTKDIVSTLTPAEGTTFDFVGVYKETTNNAGDYIVQGGEFRQADESNSVLPFRAYLKLKGTTPARSLNFVVVEDGGSTTGIDAAEISGLETVEGIYNLNGQKVETLKRGGLYIINGKKVVLRK